MAEYEAICEECKTVFRAVEPQAGRRRRFCGVDCRADYQSRIKAGRPRFCSGRCTPETAAKLMERLKGLKSGGVLAERIQEMRGRG